MTPLGWNTTVGIVPGSVAPVTDLIQGSAGVILAAIWAGGEDAASIAATGGVALLHAADQTGDGLDWAMVPGMSSRAPNYSHGTAGVATALAIAGAALGRADFTAAAAQGARHLLAVGTMDHDGFIVPHTLPRSTRDVDPVTYNWCHGPAGTSQLFAALALAGVDEIAGLPVTWLRQRCLDAILASGVPARLRPGFWDNDGRCCGTAGVGDVLLDAAQDCGGQVQAGRLLQGARTMADALAERVIRDQAGARWRFTEHRQDPPQLPPGTSWMQGAAGIAAFLLRLARVLDSGLTAPVVDRPDQCWAVPARLRTIHTGPPAPPDPAYHLTPIQARSRPPGPGQGRPDHPPQTTSQPEPQASHAGLDRHRATPKNASHPFSGESSRRTRGADLRGKLQSADMPSEPRQNG
jgi:hypothetical protein